MKKYIKSKAKPNEPGPGYRTESSFLHGQITKTSMFSGKNTFQQQKGTGVKFSPGLFKTQHKG